MPPDSGDFIDIGSDSYGLIILMFFVDWWDAHAAKRVNLNQILDYLTLF